MPRDDRRGSSFKYTPRSREQMQKRASQQGGTREGYLVDEVKVWTPSAGDHRIRILPPTWPDNQHYGFDVFAHYGIGTDGSTFLCLEDPPLGHDKDECPCCLERVRANEHGEEELARRLRANKRVLVWMIDRDKESDGPQIWPMPWTFDKDLAKICVDPVTQEVYAPDDPDRGYDVIFTREGQGPRTKYTGVQLSRRESPLSDDTREQDRWLDYVQDHPIPDCLIVADRQKIADELAGGVKLDSDFQRGGDRDRDRDDEPRRRPRDDDRDRRSSRDDRDERPRMGRRPNGDARERDRDDDRRSSRRAPRADYDYADLSNMTDDELIKIADENDLKLDDRGDILEQVCEGLKIEIPRRATSRRDDRDDDRRSSSRDRDDDRRSSRDRDDRDDDRRSSRSSRDDEPERPRMQMRERSTTRDRDDDREERPAREGSRTGRLRESMAPMRDRR